MRRSLPQQVRQHQGPQRAAECVEEGRLASASGRAAPRRRRSRYAFAVAGRGQQRGWRLQQMALSVRYNPRLHVFLIQLEPWHLEKSSRCFPGGGPASATQQANEYWSRISRRRATRAAGTFQKQWPAQINCRRPPCRRVPSSQQGTSSQQTKKRQLIRYHTVQCAMSPKKIPAKTVQQAPSTSRSERPACSGRAAAHR